MLTKTIVAALLATAAVALPVKTARDSTTIPDWILNPEPIDEHNRPGNTPVKRDPNSPVNFWTPEAPTSDAEETADLDKRFYIYHRPPPPGAESVEKRGVIPDWILNPEPIDRPGQPSARVKRDPDSSLKFWTPKAPVEKRDVVPDWILSPPPIDEQHRPGDAPEKRDIIPDWILNPEPIDRAGQPSARV